MANMQNNKTPVTEQPAAARAKNFSEVCLGYTAEEAQNEASRCLNCKHKPCVAGCPVAVDIPSFIEAVKEGDPLKAYDIITNTNSLPAVCGRVCPQESQCEKQCVRRVKGESVAIGRLERFAADFAMSKGTENSHQSAKNGIKTAVIGSGPAGLSCAGALAKKGYDVTVFEALHKPGGVLSYGIPEFRLPKALVNDEIDCIKKLGVKIVTNFIAGRSATLDQLFEEGYKAIFIGSGAGLPSFMGIPGENLNGVYSANEFLTRVNLMGAYNFPENDTPVRIGRNVAVIGGGNVAMDAARCALRLGAENVYIVYRRGEEEMPARVEEIHHAKEEGVQFMLLCAPTEILDDGSWGVSGIRLVKMELGEPDTSGRRRPVTVPGSEFTLPVQTVIPAIGQAPNPLIRETTKGLVCKSFGGIETDESGLTSREMVFAGGDAVTGAATVILAMGAGKTAAEAMDQALRKKYPDLF